MSYIQFEMMVELALQLQTEHQHRLQIKLYEVKRRIKMVSKTTYCP